MGMEPALCRAEDTVPAIAGWLGAGNGKAGGQQEHAMEGEWFGGGRR